MVGSLPGTNTRAESPTHVNMFSDTVLPMPDTHITVAVVGTYKDNGINATADFTATPGIATGLSPQIVSGTFYAGWLVRSWLSSRLGRGGLCASRLFVLFLGASCCG